MSDASSYSFAPSVHGVHRVPMRWLWTRVERTNGETRSSEAIMKISKVETFLVRWGDVDHARPRPTSLR